ncbi:hypothetical protein CkaCkLH20_01993 [Colletotrichum karsti]|uniref:Uncharacterized protein n=1 Tax=Colletotrichum karsti TaxID=1095194 RepID=A0A9P6LPX6_9PEZI|nr:uncharacterized protein CkaCkLH20_01993 [Colletotrichum karsti]KAF9880951.1 hypothetical protein CkaCkLH20_01993 [Colletotrichum karsti]
MPFLPCPRGPKRPRRRACQTIYTQLRAIHATDLAEYNHAAKGLEEVREYPAGFVSQAYFDAYFPRDSLATWLPLQNNHVSPSNSKIRLTIIEKLVSQANDAIWEDVPQLGQLLGEYEQLYLSSLRVPGCGKFILAEANYLHPCNIVAEIHRVIPDYSNRSTTSMKRRRVASAEEEDDWPPQFTVCGRHHELAECQYVLGGPDGWKGNRDAHIERKRTTESDVGRDIAKLYEEKPVWLRSASARVRVRLRVAMREGPLVSSPQHGAESLAARKVARHFSIHEEVVMRAMAVSDRRKVHTRSPKESVRRARIGVAAGCPPPQPLSLAAINTLSQLRELRLQNTKASDKKREGLEAQAAWDAPEVRLPAYRKRVDQLQPRCSWSHGSPRTPVPDPLVDKVENVLMTLRDHEA